MPPTIVALALILLVWPVAGAGAADWGGVVPGTTTMDAVRSRYGPPTRTSSQKVKDRDAPIWIYEGPQAPRGLVRMTVEFGAATPAGVRSDVVGLMRLEPQRGIFTRSMIVAGWGEPTRVSPIDQPPPMFFYASGLIVAFDAEGQQAEWMVFTPPLPLPSAPGPPPR